MTSSPSTGHRSTRLRRSRGSRLRRLGLPTGHALIGGFRELRLSVFLILALILGGTSQDVWAPKLILILISLAVAAWVLAEKSRLSLSSLRRAPYRIGIAVAALYMIYLIPLPPALWSWLPGRDRVVEGFDLLAQAAPSAVDGLPWMPLSLAPEQTLGGLLCLVPVMACALILGLSARSSEIKRSVDGLILFALMSVALAVTQSVLRMDVLHPYDISNVGFATGLFANANHFGVFLAMIMPLAWYRVHRRLIHSRRENKRTGGLDTMGALSGIYLVLAIGAIALTGSIAALGLAVIALLGSMAITSRRIKRVHVAALGVLVLIAAAADIFVLQGQLIDMMTNFRTGSDLSRGNMARTGAAMIGEFGAVGIGPGALEAAYPQFEDPGVVRRIYVNQLHNDVLQVIVEFGVAGALLLSVGLFGIARIIWRNLGAIKDHRRPMIFALIMALPVLHSLVDYPLRNIGMAVLFAYAWILAARAQRGSGT